MGAMELINRGDERRLLDGVLRDVRSGQSRVLVLHGDPGVGKSALMEYLAGQSFRVSGQHCTSGPMLSGWASGATCRVALFGTASPFLRQDIAYSAHMTVGSRTSVHSSRPKLYGLELLWTTV